MSQTRTTERYRGYDVIFVVDSLMCRGKAWTQGESPIEALGPGVAEVRQDLHRQIDDALHSAKPTRQFVRALRRLQQAGRPDSDWAMLKAHYRAPKRTATASELAAAVGFPNYNTVNMRYGLLGQAIYEEALVRLPDDARNVDGKPIYTFVIAHGQRLGNDDWRWTMRQEVVEAIEELGLDA
jgi:hypothetical protein